MTPSKVSTSFSLTLSRTLPFSPNTPHKECECHPLLPAAFQKSFNALRAAWKKQADMSKLETDMKETVDELNSQRDNFFDAIERFNPSVTREQFDKAMDQIVDGFKTFSNSFPSSYGKCIVALLKTTVCSMFLTRCRHLFAPPSCHSSPILPQMFGFWWLSSGWKLLLDL